MKIAVTYDNGSVFQHFGKTENFKIFEVENGAIISSEVVGSNGAGHSALAGFLADAGVDVVICGGIGGGAQEALSEAGIKVCAGVSGDVNEAAESYVNGTLECTSEGNCDHHHEEGGHCCHGEESEESGCEGGCGGCHGGCGTPEPIMEGKNVGKKCRTHYKGTFNDGTQFDSSYDRGEPLEFICGVGQMIRGFDQAVANMEVGESVEIHLMPEEACRIRLRSLHLRLRSSQVQRNLRQVSRYICLISLVSHSQLRLLQKMIRLLLLMQTMRWQARN